MEQELNKIYPLVPRIGVGGITIHEGRVLLVKRGVAPNRGQWAIPGGTLQLGETLQECVAREIFEETGITIKVGVCAYVFDYLERDDAGKSQISLRCRRLYRGVRIRGAERRR